MGAGILIIFISAFLSPILFKWLKYKASYVLALVPLGFFTYLLINSTAVADGGNIQEKYQWLDGLGIHFSFSMDGLSLLFGLLISGIGTLIVLYGGSYLKKYALIGRFFMYLMLFMGAMLGLVFSNNLMGIFVFWEMTSLSSFLLIGFKHEDEESRKSALQALLVTAGGGLALLAGLVLTGFIAGTYDMTLWPENNELIHNHSLYLPAMLLILVGCFTKSAQMPFHFWLPNAMAAPTPVSAYLHSATMVKAGIYLLARMTPTFGGTIEWTYILTFFGGITMIIGAIMAIQHTDLKKILAYTTISALGILVLLLGIGTTIAFKAAMIFLLAHAMYKGAFFMIAGNIDHKTGTRETNRLGGLFKKMPLTGLAAIFAAFSMAGLPPLFGFISKEMLYEAALDSSVFMYGVTAAVIASGMIFVSLAFLLSYKIFFTPLKQTPFEAREVAWPMYLGPALLGLTGLLIGFLPIMQGDFLLSAAASAISIEPIEIKISFWHGFNIVLILSIITVIAGLALHFLTPALLKITSPLKKLSLIGPEKLYFGGLNGTLDLSDKLTRYLQNGYLRNYISTIILTVTILCLWIIFKNGLFYYNIAFLDITIYDILLGILIVVSIWFTVTTNIRLAALLSLGIVGYGIAVFYAIYGGTDLPMTQFLVETLTVVVFVYIVYKLPPFIPLSNRRRRLFDASLSVVFGLTMAAIIIIVTEYPGNFQLKEFFAENSYLLGKGRNVVNVILVDFRAIDTFGEIVVLTIAAIGVFALIKLRLSKENQRILDRITLKNKNAQGEGLNTIILKDSGKILFPILIISSFLLLFRGHNEPGGGFIGGLVAASAFILLNFSLGVEKTKKIVPLDSLNLIILGLVLALAGGSVSLFTEGVFFKAIFADFYLPIIGMPSTVLIFDIGVYFVVIGIILKIIFSIADE